MADYPVTPLTPPLSEQEIVNLGVESEGESTGVKTVKVNYAVGSSVKIIQGPLEGFVGKVEELDADNDKLKVTVSMFGRDTLVELTLGQAELVKE